MDEPTEYVVQRIANCSLLSRSHRETHSPMAVCSSVCAVPNIPIILFLSPPPLSLSLSLLSPLSVCRPTDVAEDARQPRRHAVLLCTTSVAARRSRRYLTKTHFGSLTPVGRTDGRGRTEPSCTMKKEITIDRVSWLRGGCMGRKGGRNRRATYVQSDMIAFKLAFKQAAS